MQTMHQPVVHLTLLEWFSLARKEGPKFGYVPEPSKSFLVVDVRHVSEAEEKFADLGINVVCSHTLLGKIIRS